MNKIVKYVGAALITLSGSVSYASISYSGFGRYMSVTSQSSSNDSFGLNSTVQREFPPNTKTVGEAIRLTLKGTGYRLLEGNQASNSAKKLYALPLPVYLKEIGPMPLKMALIKLSGATYQLIVDPVHRLVTYKVRKTYASL